MQMNQKGPLTDKQIAALEKNEAKEAQHTLVVKIISWRDGLADGSFIKQTDKVTSKEWQTYKKHLLKISVTDSKAKVMEKIDATFAAIKRHGGFEKGFKD